MVVTVSDLVKAEKCTNELRSHGVHITHKGAWNRKEKKCKHISVIRNNFNKLGMCCCVLHYDFISSLMTGGHQTILIFIALQYSLSIIHNFIQMNLFYFLIAHEDVVVQMIYLLPQWWIVAMSSPLCEPIKIFYCKFKIGRKDSSSWLTGHDDCLWVYLPDVSKWKWYPLDKIYFLSHTEVTGTAHSLSV